MAILSVRLSSAEEGRRLEIPRQLGSRGWSVGRDLREIFGGEISPGDYQVYRSDEGTVQATHLVDKTARRGVSRIQLEKGESNGRSLLALRAYEAALTRERADVKASRTYVAIFSVMSNCRPTAALGGALAVSAELTKRRDIPPLARLAITSPDSFIDTLQVGSQVLACAYTTPEDEAANLIATAMGAQSWPHLHAAWEQAGRERTPVSAAVHVLRQLAVPQ